MRIVVVGGSGYVARQAQFEPNREAVREAARPSQDVSMRLPAIIR